MVGLSRFELLTPRLSSVCSNQLSYRPRYSPFGLADVGLRILNPHSAFRDPHFKEPALPVLSKLDSARLRSHRTPNSQIDRRDVQESCARGRALWSHSRKEVIQPQVLLQLPCYDFTPITDHTLGASLPCGLVWRLLVQPAFVM
jgi:hypothetical protein